MIITSKKVLQFYKNNPHYDINSMNEMFIDLITNLLSQIPKQNMDENTITVLLKNMQQNINSIHSSQTQIASEFNTLQKSMIDSVQLQLLTSKNEYMKELEKSISAAQNNNFDKHQNIANTNLKSYLINYGYISMINLKRHLIPSSNNFHLTLVLNLRKHIRLVT